MKIFLKFSHFFLLIFCIILQISFMEQLKIFYINIDLILVAVLGIAVFDGSIFGLLFGFISGMLFDLFTGGIIGVNALLYSLSGYFAGRIIKAGFQKKIGTYVLIVFSFTEINLLLKNAILYLFNYNLNPFSLGLEMLINPACNIVFMFLIFPLLRTGIERSEEIGFSYKDQI